MASPPLTHDGDAQVKHDEWPNLTGSFSRYRLFTTGERGERGDFSVPCFVFFCLYKQHVTEQTPDVDVDGVEHSLMS